MKKFLKIGLKLLKIFLEFGVFLAIILAVSLGNSKNIPFLKNYQFFVVVSGSMEPAIKTGSLVLVNKSINVEDLKVSDIITFETPRTKKIVTHRIVEIKTIPEQQRKLFNEDKFFISTKGDANDKYDPWVLTDKYVKGKVVFTIPYLGYISTYAKTPKGFILIVLLPALFIIFDEVLSIKRFYEEEFKQKVKELESKLSEKQK